MARSKSRRPRVPERTLSVKGPSSRSSLVPTKDMNWAIGVWAAAGAGRVP